MNSTSFRQNLRGELGVRAFIGVDVLIGIFTLVLLAAMVLPMLDGRRGMSRGPRIRCMNNLRQIGLGYRVWALDHGDKYPMQVAVTNGGAVTPQGVGQAHVPFLVMSNELSTPCFLTCPDDRRRTSASSFGKGFGDSNISYFVGLDADSANPQWFLSGDDNLTMAGQPLKAGLNNLWTNRLVAWGNQRHKEAGNLGLADGSVQQVPSARLSAFFTATGAATNRLLLP